VATLRSHPTWQFQNGETVALGWSHPTDTLHSGNPNYPIFFRGGEGTTGYIRILPTVVGDEVRFWVPPPGLRAGDGHLDLAFATTKHDATTCIGATSCSFQSSHIYSHSARIDRR
jgi:hypothetical protein